MQEVVKQKIQNLRHLSEHFKKPNLLKELADADQKGFTTSQAVELWFRTVLDKDPNKALAAKWKNVFDRMHCYREVWKDIKESMPEDIIEIQKVLNLAEPKMDFENKDEITELTVKFSVAVYKNQKVKEFVNDLKNKVHEMANAKASAKTTDKSTDKQASSSIKSVPGRQAEQVIKKEPVKETVPTKNAEIQLVKKETQKSSSVQKNAKQISFAETPSSNNRNSIGKKEEKKEQAPKNQRVQPERVEHIKRELPSYNDTKPARIIPQSRSKPATHVHDQLKPIQARVSSLSNSSIPSEYLNFGGQERSISILIRNQMNQHMKGVLCKLIRLASISNTQSSKDQFSYFSKQNESNCLLFPNQEFHLLERVPKRDKFYKVIYPNKLKIYAQLRIEQEREQERLRVEDRRKRKENEREIFEFVRGDPRNLKMIEYKEENTRSDKLMIKLAMVQAMMQMDHYYSNSNILHMSYYL